LDPQWIVNAFSCIITSEKFIANNHPDLLEMWKKCTATGVLPIDLMRTIWHNNNTTHSTADKDILQLCMERLGLTVRPLTELKSTSHTTDYFIVPSMLPEDNRQLEWLDVILKQDDIVRTTTLCFAFVDDVPNVTFDKFLAVCIYTFPGFLTNEEENERSSYQRGFGCFKIDEFWNMILFCRMSKVTVTLFSLDEKKNIDRNVCIDVHNQVRGILMDTLDMNLQRHLVYHYELHQNDKIQNLTKKYDDTDMYQKELDVWFLYGKLQQELVTFDILFIQSVMKDLLKQYTNKYLRGINNSITEQGYLYLFHSKR